MAFENQIRIVSVVLTCLIEQVFVFKRMPYERQLKERQVYNRGSIFVELIKSDVNLKFRQKLSSNIIYRISFQGVEYGLRWGKDFPFKTYICMLQMPIT